MLKPLRREKANSQNTNSLDTRWSSINQHANGGLFYPHVVFEHRIDVSQKFKDYSRDVSAHPDRPTTIRGRIA